MAVATIVLGMFVLSIAGCDRRPGYNAYGRYSGNSSSSSEAVYDRLKSSDKDDWFKDRAM
ncbi:MAG: hypothetical protein ACM30I_00840 [Gemmatimonas sp.]